MSMPPEGSKIKIDHDRGKKQVIIPYESGVMRYFLALFLIFWLGGWYNGWNFAAKELLDGHGKADAFLVFWLGGWTIGGIFAIYFLFRLLRPSVPETILLETQTLNYDSGVAPFNPLATSNPFSVKAGRDWWKRLLEKRKRLEISYEQLNTLKLREFSEGNRLTIDHGNDRLELAISATEPEREWLYDLIRSHYSLPEQS